MKFEMNFNERPKMMGDVFQITKKKKKKKKNFAVPGPLCRLPTRFVDDVS